MVLTTGDYNVIIGSDYRTCNRPLANTIVLSDGEGNERMRVDSTGNVGIGTTTPSDKLDVHGVIAIDSAALIDKDGNKVIIGDIDAVDDIGFLDLNTADASTRLFLDDSGHVGINTDNPLVDLHVVGELLGNTDGDSLTHVTIEGERHHLDVKEVRTATLEEQDWKNTTLKLQLRVDSTNHQSIDFVSDDSFQEHIDILTGNQLFNTRFTADGKVGIGTASPGANLEVFGTGNTLRLDSDANGSKEILFRNVGTGTATIKTDGDLKLYAEDAGKNILFDTTGGEKMRITSGGNVGIGTASPRSGEGTPLTLESSTGYVGLTLSGTGDYANVWQLYASGDGSSNNFFGIYDRTNSVYTLATTDDGNVGIGTTTPGSKLEIDSGAPGSIKLGELSNYNGISLNGTLNIQNYNLLSRSTDKALYINRPSGNDILFRENNTDTQVVIKSGGNVGIGTTSPSQKLHVVGKALITDDVQLTGSNPRIDFNSNGASSLRFYDTNAALERMRINEDGNVGIGDSAPSFILDVNNADSRVRFKAGTGDSNLELSAIAGRDWLIQSKADGEFRIYDEDAAAVRFNIDTSGNIQLPAYTAGYLKSDASGNITVDSDTIEDTLDSVTTRGNTTTNNITIGGLTLTGTDNYIKTDTVDGLDTKSMHILSGTANSSSRGAYVSVYGNEHASQAGRVYIVSGDKAGAELRINSVNASGFTTFFQGGSERMRVHSNGNVGIGTTSPAEILHIRNNGTARVEVEGTTGPAAFKATNNSGSYGWYVHDTTDSFRLFDFNDSADRITVDGDGNVGIGTTSPGAKLDVAGSVYVRSGNQLRLYNPVGNDWAVLNYTGTNVLNINNTITLQNSGGVNSLYPNITEATDLGTSSLKFRNGYLSGDLTIGGNVGIGTASPSEKLHVVGNVRIEGDLTVNGSYTQIDTDVNTTEQWNVTNDGTGPAVTINQTGAQDIMDVQDDGTSVFYIEDGGNVGLGTTNPTTTLDVRGDIKAEGANTPTISVKDTTNDLVGRIRAANSYVYLTADHGDTVSSSRIVFQVDGDSSAYVTNGLFAAETSVQFTTYGSGTETGTAAYALAVDSSGNVIETAVQGSPTGGSGTGNYLAKWETSSTLTDSPIYDNGGNIGIGTASPAALLHINGSGDAIRVTSTNAGAGGAQIDLLQFSASPADNDTMAYINMGGYYSGTSSAYFSSIRTVATDIAGKKGELQFWTNNGSTVTQKPWG